MSRVWERILPVQDSRCPQDATLTGEGAQNLQDQMLNGLRAPGPGVTPHSPPEGPETEGDSGSRDFPPSPTRPQGPGARGTPEPRPGP